MIAMLDSVFLDLITRDLTTMRGPIWPNIEYPSFVGME